MDKISEMIIFYLVHLLQHLYFNSSQKNKFYFRVHLHDLKLKIIHHLEHCIFWARGLAQWLGRGLSDQGVLGSSPGLAPFVVALSKSHLPLA